MAATAGETALIKSQPSRLAPEMLTGTIELAHDYTSKKIYLTFILIHFRCYNCIKNDYGSTYHEISYQAVFKTDAEGNRVIECADNAKSDGENACRCDAAFAEAIKFNQDQCDVRIFSRSTIFMMTFRMMLKTKAAKHTASMKSIELQTAVEITFALLLSKTIPE